MLNQLPLAELRALFRTSPAFRRVFLADVATQIGDGGLLVALPTLLLERTHDLASAGLAFAGEILAFGLFSSFAGLAADRLEQKTLMIAANVARLLIYAVMLFACEAAWPAGSFLWLSFALGAAGAFFVPARTAFVRRLLVGEALERAIALEGTAGFLLRLVSPPLMGLLLSVWPASAGIALELVMMALALACLAPGWVRGRPHEPAAPASEGAWWEGWRVVATSPSLRRLLAFDMAMSAVGCAAFALSVALLAQALHLPSTANAWLLATTGLSGAIGTVLARRFGRSPRAVLGLAGGVALSYTLVPFAPSLVALVAVWSLRGLAIGAFCVMANQRIATEVPAAVSGRVQAVWGLSACLSMFAGTASTPWLLHHGGAVHAYALFGALLGAVVVAASAAELARLPRRAVAEASLEAG